MGILMAESKMATARKNVDVLWLLHWQQQIKHMLKKN